MATKITRGLLNNQKVHDSSNKNLQNTTNKDSQWAFDKKYNFLGSADLKRCDSTTTLISIDSPLKINKANKILKEAVSNNNKINLKNKNKTNANQTNSNGQPAKDISDNAKHPSTKTNTTIKKYNSDKKDSSIETQTMKFNIKAHNEDDITNVYNDSKASNQSYLDNHIDKTTSVFKDFNNNDYESKIVKKDDEKNNPEKIKSLKNFSAVISENFIIENTNINNIINETKILNCDSSSAKDCQSVIPASIPSEQQTDTSFNNINTNSSGKTIQSMFSIDSHQKNNEKNNRISNQNDKFSENTKSSNVCQAFQNNPFVKEEEEENKWNNDENGKKLGAKPLLNDCKKAYCYDQSPNKSSKKTNSINNTNESLPKKHKENEKTDINNDLKNTNRVQMEETSAQKLCDKLEKNIGRNVSEEGSFKQGNDNSTGDFRDCTRNLESIESHNNYDLLKDSSERNVYNDHHYFSVDPHHENYFSKNNSFDKDINSNFKKTNGSSKFPHCTSPLTNKSNVNGEKCDKSFNLKNPNSDAFFTEKNNDNKSFLTKAYGNRGHDSSCNIASENVKNNYKKSLKEGNNKKKIERLVKHGVQNYPSYLRLIYTGDSEASSEDEFVRHFESNKKKKHLMVKSDSCMGLQKPAFPAFRPSFNKSHYEKVTLFIDEEKNESDSEIFEVKDETTLGKTDALNHSSGYGGSESAAMSCGSDSFNIYDQQKDDFNASLSSSIDFEDWLDEGSCLAKSRSLQVMKNKEQINLLEDGSDEDDSLDELNRTDITGEGIRVPRSHSYMEGRRHLEMMWTMELLTLQDDIDSLKSVLDTKMKLAKELRKKCKNNNDSGKWKRRFSSLSLSETLHKTNQVIKSLNLFSCVKLTQRRNSNSDLDGNIFQVSRRAV